MADVPETAFRAGPGRTLLDYLRVPPLIPLGIPFISGDGIQLFLLGAGVIVLGEIIVRLIVPRYRKRIFGSLIGAVALLALGFGNWELVGPLVIIAIGVSALLGGLIRRR